MMKTESLRGFTKSKTVKNRERMKVSKSSGRNDVGVHIQPWRYKPEQKMRTIKISDLKIGSTIVINEFISIEIDSIYYDVIIYKTFVHGQDVFRTMENSYQEFAKILLGHGITVADIADHCNLGDPEQPKANNEGNSLVWGTELPEWFRDKVKKEAIFPFGLNGQTGNELKTAAEILKSLQHKWLGDDGELGKKSFNDVALLAMEEYKNQQDPITWIYSLSETHNQIINLIIEELIRAELKHPDWPTDVVYKAAIVSEESGELMRAAVQYEMEGGDIEDVRTEAIQTAATCIRLLLNLPDHKTIKENREPKSCTSCGRMVLDLMVIGDHQICETCYHEYDKWQKSRKEG